LSIWQKLEKSPFATLRRLQYKYRNYIKVPRTVYFKALRELRKLDYLKDVKKKTVTLYFKSEHEMNKAINILLKYFEGKRVKVKVEK
jgi:hypothetical protein